ncbi:YafY family transcriptional regulator [Paenibacillus sp. KQZ6P-2]|uniref:YafY family transcriptional regulator n=1 Tax=Paenibacillus mangrovi TaxID=2931978 RepID=A0A9X1WPD4_9BACL|nr:YafY family protein [Paenibacillus mangrovi]MCJ8012912.1 YafY family transcriptional regulator [Paenibacillus mangrovi]
MNRTDRLLAIVLELQGRKIVRAEELAARFETSVRTIYRDMQALSEANVPIVGAPGQGYSLMEGYFLPPLSFSASEAVTLLLGAEFVQKKLEPNYGIHAESSKAKLEAVLPEQVRHEAEQVRATMRLLTSRKEDGSKHERENMEVLRRAMLDRRKIRFHYAKTTGPVPQRDSTRVAAPYGLVHVQGVWMLVAACELRREIRHFRLSRMSGLEETTDSYEFPPDFNLEAYRPQDDRDMEVILLADHGIADRVRESHFYYIDTFEEDHPEGLRVKLRIRRMEEILSWVLGWGAGVIVLEPEALRSRVLEEAEKLLKRY